MKSLLLLRKEVLFRCYPFFMCEYVIWLRLDNCLRISGSSSTYLLDLVKWMHLISLRRFFSRVAHRFYLCLFWTRITLVGTRLNIYIVFLILNILKWPGIERETLRMSAQYSTTRKHKNWMNFFLYSLKTRLLSIHDKQGIKLS